MSDKIKELIKQKKTLDNQTLTYFVNYFSILMNDNLILSDIELEELILNALMYADKIVFYDENHQVYKENGPDTKGFRDPKTKTIFIRKNLEEPLREITIYHELHHATQTNPSNDEVGINQESNIGRLIMEAETQYIAEKIYSEIHNINFEEKTINSENLRMIGNGMVTSSLHNYELYDNLLSKLAIMLDVSKDYFVSINFLYKNNEGLKKLEIKYNEAKEKYQLPYNFYDLLLMLDYIYCVDLIGYKENPDKQNILDGKETECFYEIYPNKNFKLSLKRQREYINAFDVDNFLSLASSNGDFKRFSKYIIDNEKRELANLYIDTYFDKGSENYGRK